MYGNYGRYQPSVGVPTQPMQNQYIQPITPTPMPTATYMPPTSMSVPSLLGKVVDSIDVVKATDIPLDGSTSYFPLVDESAIITKKLHTDGTSRTVVYKPVIEESKDEKEDIKFDNFVLIEDFKDLKNELENLKYELKKIKEEKTQKKESKQ